MDISVILPTYKRSKILTKTLEDFCKLNTDGLIWELIIVDNADDPATQNVVKEYEKRLPIKFLVETKPGKNNALNSAIPEAKGDLFVFTDDDVTPDKEWLQKIVRATARWPDVRVFGGRVEPIFPHNVSDRITNAAFSGYVFGQYHPYKNEGICNETTPSGANCWLRREIFDAGLRYDPSIGPDGSHANRKKSGSELEFFERLLNAGEKIVYVPTALVFHNIQRHQTTYRYLLKRAYAGGRGWARIYDSWHGCKKIGGIPIFLFKKMLEEAGTSFSYFLKGQNYLEPLMQLLQSVGTAVEYRKMHRERRHGSKK